MRRFTLFWVLAVLLVACGAPQPPVVLDEESTTSLSSPPDSSSTTQSLASATTVSAALSTSTTMGTVPAVQELGADFIRFGSVGVSRVVGGIESVVVSTPVDSAFDDGRGGVVYSTWDEGRNQNDIYWLPEGASAAELVVSEQGGFTLTHIDGHPTLILLRYGGEDWTGDCKDYEVGAVLHDLDSGEERLLTCNLPMEDAWLFPDSQGGGLFVGSLGVAFGATGTSVRLVFWDENGTEVEVVHNPFPDSCTPCTIDARLSPDGTRLAYYHRPDAKWPPDEWDEHPDDEWWQQSKHIPAVIAVIDLQTGERIFEVDLAADEGSLTDFDGQYLVISDYEPGTGTTHSTIIDTSGQTPTATLIGDIRLVRDQS